MDRRGSSFNKCSAYPSGSKRRKKSKRGKNERGRSCSQVKKHSSDYFTVTMKSSGDSREKIEEPVVTDLDLCNDENRPSSTSSAVEAEHQNV